MVRFVVAILSAGVAVFMFGFCYWGLSPLVNNTLSEYQGKDHAAVQQSLLETFPEKGTYMIPFVPEDYTEWKELMKSGPTAMVHLTSTEGGEENLALGFLLTIVTAFFLAVVLVKIGSRCGVWEKAQILFLAAFSISFLDNGNDWIFWNYDSSWVMLNLVYQALASAIYAVVLSLILGSSATTLGKKDECQAKQRTPQIEGP
ncbi:MAG: hypothetical protein MPJ24_10180 [Pirellulaceae bacterium]|nr:hypothetical protein [Pirellulaceae bacterium]